MQACRDQAGPEPGAIGNAFGLIGLAVISSMHDHQAWEQKVDTCFQQKTASVPQ